MHDPMTMAFRIKAPWHVRKGKDRYRPIIVTIWHVDPERDGSDDSCGWSWPKLTKRQFDRLHAVAWGEARDPYFLRFQAKRPPHTNRFELESLYRGLVLLVADTLNIPCTFDQAARFAARRIHNPDTTDPASVFCYLDGYHTNFPDVELGSSQDRRYREDHFVSVMAGIARELMRDRRPRFRHPRWHFWHWQVNIEPVIALKRWLSTRAQAHAV